MLKLCSTNTQDGPALLWGLSLVTRGDITVMLIKVGTTFQLPLMIFLWDVKGLSLFALFLEKILQDFRYIKICCDPFGFSLETL